jgi:hypothetical protein
MAAAMKTAISAATAISADRNLPRTIRIDTLPARPREVNAGAAPDRT